MPFPTWLAAPGITTIQVTAQEFAGGVLATPSGQAAVDFFTTVKRIHYRHDVEHRNIVPTNSRQRNLVIVETGASFTISELLRTVAHGSGGAHSFNSLALLFHSWDYFKVVFARASKTYTFWAVNGGYEEEPMETHSIGTAMFESAGVVETGVAQTKNPAYT